MVQPMSPLFFTPLIKRIVWGGRRLGDLLGKPIGPASDYAESWEIVDHGADQSVVEVGPLAGQTLGGLLRVYNAELLGRHAGQDRFPLLLKYLDCHRVLSVQVHPDDDYARTMQEPDLGKTEAWYVVDAVPGSRIYAGLKPGVDRPTLAAAVRSGRTEDCLHSWQPQAGECVFIPAGTVHALGGGLVVAEIQQSSDTTFRLFDWNRVGDDGQPRTLHVDQALDVTDFARGPVTAQSPRVADDGTRELVACDRFVLREARLTPAESVRLGGDDTLRLLTVPHGAAVLETTDGPSYNLPLGRSVLLPAALSAVSVRADAPETIVLIAELP